ncbi:DUF7344 domain-containing protein [Haloarchaeobius baliensis]|uniref:DUF7344 domain-containing protein n=1 Tax=Haloarchaeobius baliensis TaxID=1670458 RepID=UPI003F885DAE
MGRIEAEELSEIHTLLAHPYRRYALDYLSQQAGGVEREELARGIVEWTGGETGRTVEDVELQLHHVHLPKLSEAGLITYSPNPGKISLAESRQLDTVRRVRAEVGAGGESADGQP